MEDTWILIFASAFNLSWFWGLFLVEVYVKKILSHTDV